MLPVMNTLPEASVATEFADRGLKIRASKALAPEVAPGEAVLGEDDVALKAGSYPIAAPEIHGPQECPGHEHVAGSVRRDRVSRAFIAIVLPKPLAPDVCPIGAVLGEDDVDGEAVSSASSHSPEIHVPSKNPRHEHIPGIVGCDRVSRDLCPCLPKHWLQRWVPVGPYLATKMSDRAVAHQIAAPEIHGVSEVSRDEHIAGIVRRDRFRFASFDTWPVASKTLWLQRWVPVGLYLARKTSLEAGSLPDCRPRNPRCPRISR